MAIPQALDCTAQSFLKPTISGNNTINCSRKACSKFQLCSRGETKPALVPGVQEKQSPIENTQNKAYQDLWSQLLLQHFEHPHPALL
jgi:hypothetical protein